jgi:hypothetical protein
MGTTQIHRIPFDPALIERLQTLSKEDPSQYVILDNDDNTCRVIEQAELFGSYVDGNIATYQLDGIETWPQVPNPDLHNVILDYQNGNKVTISVGSISLDPGPGPAHYLKSGGVIYPIDDSGAALLDATNTPNLSFIRNQYWDMARKQVETNLFYAEIVANFANDVSGLAHAGEAANFVTSGGVDSPEFNGVVPTPSDDVDPPSPSQGSGDGSSNN